MRLKALLRPLTSGFIFCVAAANTLAQAAPDIQAKTGNSAYMQDSRGTIARSPFGLCWRSGYWSATDAVPGCDGELVPPIANPIAPAIVAPAAPAAPPSPKRCDFSITLNNDQTFGFDKTTLSSAAKKRIDDEVLSRLESCAKIEIILLTGHSDRLGSQQYNQRLSERRAGAVAAHLKNKGVIAEIDILGAGKTQSIKACEDKLPKAQLIDCLAPNRRVVVEVRGPAK
jgi:OmpA-OmpF porin, OOP family